MGLRFRRSFHLSPGWRVNLSKSGVSTSIGRRGAWFTIGPRGTRETIGIPGTGVSWTEQQAAAPAHSRATSVVVGLFALAIVFAIGWIIGTFIS
jgi:hypothetical protein